MPKLADSDVIVSKTRTGAHTPVFDTEELIQIRLSGFNLKYRRTIRRSTYHCDKMSSSVARNLTANDADTLLIREVKFSTTYDDVRNIKIESTQTNLD